MKRTLWKKIGNTRVIPVTLKIILLFTLFILVSNLTSNYINLIFNRAAQTKLMKQLLVKDLKSMNNFCNTQFEINRYTYNIPGSIKKIEEKGSFELKNKKAVILGIRTSGNMFFQASSTNIKKQKNFLDTETLNVMNEDLKNKKEEEFIYFLFNDEEYFGVYKYNPKWKIFILRAEELYEFHQDSRKIFTDISIIIIIITLVSALVGVILLRYILRFISIISSSIMKMIRTQKMELIDLKNAPNDDITFLGIAFNSLSNTIDNLVTIFRKFASRDVAMKAYQEKTIRLEGEKKELAILFSDIKSFTYITETLGTDIIKLLNMHYDKVIRQILEHKGTIGSIIGDAILAIFGALDTEGRNKSFLAVRAAYKLQEVSELLRMKMYKTKEEIVKMHGAITSEEEKVFKAVLLEIGVGIDGGEVFYGNIGSNERMTNTVIGDNVNSASRLEGLTRTYKVPVICSEYIKNDIEKHVKKHKLHFIEIDRVRVIGKTIGKTIYWPILDENFDREMKTRLSDFSAGLKLYYKGVWKKAYKHFKSCKLPLADVFENRIKNHKRPRNWRGIWAMKAK